MAAGVRPRLLDLGCGAGGASLGYDAAGFEVVGVDIKPQPSYPFEFHQADALTFPLDGFDVVHGSMPCQLWAPGTSDRSQHVDLVAPLRERLIEWGGLYVLENVPSAPLSGPILCGQAVGLRVIRHRRFESNAMLLFPYCCHQPGATYRGEAVAFRHDGRGRNGKVALKSGRRAWGKAAGLPPEWTEAEIRQAIPPRFTELIGWQLLAAPPNPPNPSAPRRG